MKTFRYSSLHVPTGESITYTCVAPSVEYFTAQLATWNISGRGFWVYYPEISENVKLIPQHHECLMKDKDVIHEERFETGVTHQQALEIKWEKQKLGY